MKKSKWLIIPVEVKARAFESRLMLAQHAVTQGYSVIFGNQREVTKYLSQFPRAVYFDKSISKNKEDFLRKLVSWGHTLVNLDEEGYPHNCDGYFYLKQRISQPTLKLCSKMCTWGPKEQKIVQKNYPNFKDKILSTGNPRIDLWRKPYAARYKAKAQSYREQHGPYILIPSNFASNHAKGVDGLIAQAKDYGIIEDQKEEKLFQSYLKKDAQVFKKMAKLVIALAKAQPEKSIIVRPHPAEKPEHWKAATQNLDNVKILHEGSVTPWILGADLVIHSSCTTGLEAFMLNKTVISYQPLGLNKIRTHVSDKLGHLFTEEEELLKALPKLLKNQKNPNPNLKLKELEQHFTALTGAFAAERILKEIQKLPLEDSHFTLTNRLIFYAKKMLNALKAKTANAYTLQKFPGSSKEEVDKLCQAFAKCNKKLKTPKIKALAKDLYLLS